MPSPSTQQMLPMPTSQERNDYMNMARDLRGNIVKVQKANNAILAVNRAKELIKQAICCTGLPEHGSDVFILTNSMAVDVINCDNIVKVKVREIDRLNARADELKMRMKDIERRTNINYR